MTGTQQTVSHSVHTDPALCVDWRWVTPRLLHWGSITLVGQHWDLLLKHAGNSGRTQELLCPHYRKQGNKELIKQRTSIIVNHNNTKDVHAYQYLYKCMCIVYI